MARIGDGSGCDPYDLLDEDCRNIPFEPEHWNNTRFLGDGWVPPLSPPPFLLANVTRPPPPPPITTTPPPSLTTPSSPPPPPPPITPPPPPITTPITTATTTTTTTPLAVVVDSQRSKETPEAPGYGSLSHIILLSNDYSEDDDDDEEEITHPLSKKPRTQHDDDIPHTHGTLADRFLDDDSNENEDEDEDEEDEEDIVPSLESILPPHDLSNIIRKSSSKKKKKKKKKPYVFDNILKIVNLKGFGIPDPPPSPKPYYG